MKQRMYNSLPLLQDLVPLNYRSTNPVSYTHLDVYKRQEQGMVVRHLAVVHAAACWGGFRPHLVFPFGLRADKGEQLGYFSEHLSLIHI